MTDLDKTILEAIDRIYANWRERRTWDRGASEPVITASMLVDELGGYIPGSTRAERATKAQNTLTRLYQQGLLVRSEGIGRRGRAAYGYERAPEGTLPPAKAPRGLPKREKLITDLREAAERHGWTVRQEEIADTKATMLVLTKDDGFVRRNMFIVIRAKGAVTATMATYYGYEPKPQEKKTKDDSEVFHWIARD